MYRLLLPKTRCEFSASARFAARYDFAVADETMQLMKKMVQSGEADDLVAERVGAEFSRGLGEKKPSRMIQVLRECGALGKIRPQLDHIFHGLQVPQN